MNRDSDQRIGSSLAKLLLSALTLWAINKWKRASKAGCMSQSEMQKKEWLLKAEAARRFIVQGRERLGIGPGRSEHLLLHGGQVYFKVKCHEELSLLLVEGEKLNSAKPIAEIALTPDYISITSENEVVFVDAEPDMFKELAIDEHGIVNVFLSPRVFRAIQTKVRSPLIDVMPVKFISDDDQERRRSLRPVRLDLAIALIIKSSTGESREVKILTDPSVTRAEALKMAELSPIYRKNERGEALKLDDPVGPMVLLYIPVTTFEYPPEEHEPAFKLNLERPITVRELLRDYAMPWLKGYDIEIRDENGSLLAMPTGSSEGAIIQPGQTIRSYPSRK